MLSWRIHLKADWIIQHEFHSQTHLRSKSNIRINYRYRITREGKGRLKKTREEERRLKRTCRKDTRTSSRKVVINTKGMKLKTKGMKLKTSTFPLITALR